ncbi:unnamed protein product [Meganyctiphanes norvegica]|uniref:Mid1-interacting protein 1 n=1 Tax=Meganyctiphanes norvegica TaxID=48144 RepID=A0AAV2QQG4_MEGNR
MLYDSVHRDTAKCEDNSVRMNTQDELSDFSSQSVLCDMNRFIKSVNNMNETVMVPSRLLDIEVKSNSKVPVMLRGGGDPYTFYNVLNSVKNDLIWGPTSNDDEEDEDDLSSSSSSSALTSGTSWSDPNTPTTTNNNLKRHVRRQSTLSNISMISTSDAESDGSTVSDGGDSGVDPEDSTEAVTATLRNHLIGLQSCLTHLTNTASYITERYQEEVQL